MFKQYVLIRREGLYFLVVMGFILGGAMLREVNPLLMLGGMMVGTLVISWRWAASSLRRLEIEHCLPKAINAGSPLRIGIRVTNRRRWFASWAVWVEDRIERVDSVGKADRDYSSKAETFLAYVPARQTTEGVYRCFLTRRGRYKFGPVRLHTSFPLGFLKCHRRVSTTAEAVVHPQLGTMSRDWLNLLESDGDARIRSRAGHNGFSDGDFYAIRDWRSGDSQRWIHWRTTARVSHLAVRMFERQQSRDYVLLLDLHCPEDASAAVLERVEQAVGFAATLASEICRKSTGRLAVVVAGRQNQTLHGTAAAPLLRNVMDRLAVAEGSAKVSLPEAAAMARAEAGSGAPMIVITTREEQTLPDWLEGDSPEGESLPTVASASGTLVIAVGGELYNRCYQPPG